MTRPNTPLRTVDVVCPRRRGRDLFAEKVARHAPVSVLIVSAT